MKNRTRLRDLKIPPYTILEEVFNSISHGLGIVLGIVAQVLMPIFAIKHHNIYGIVSGSIYAATLIILYAMSTIYHALGSKLLAKKVFRILDHCTIFILIAGTYTPYTLVTLRQDNLAVGWSIFGIVWGISILGIILNAIDMERYRRISLVLYLALGWCIIFKILDLYRLLGVGFYLLLAGGLSYSIGAILYVIGKKKKIKFAHTVFHLFVLIASILQMLSILLYVM